ncbi:hypothetical protein JFK97_02515 [Chromobacterium phragmitis]|uniref:hypothetical protein n=1 Tax=Chromobacterium amazonense TaxID=1382803 RepID=UPI00126A2F36|nr:hypothetical protein [Chromobacterium amazonense]MBM2883249.1 hypothetical protein [Chromobacterium amazonense]
MRTVTQIITIEQYKLEQLRDKAMRFHPAAHANKYIHFKDLHRPSTEKNAIPQLQSALRQQAMSDPRKAKPRNKLRRAITQISNLWQG